MMKFVALFAAAAVALPALAETHHFERDGVRYIADVRTDNGVQYITGRQLTGDRQHFALRVAKGKVTGKVGFTPVSYRVPAAKPIVTAASY